MIFHEFNKVRQDILADKSPEQIEVSINKKKKYYIHNVESNRGQIVVNNILIILSKVVDKMRKYYHCSTSQLVDIFKSSQFYITTLQSIELIWTLTEFGLIAFLRSRYDNTTISQAYFQPEDYTFHLKQMLSDQLHVDLTALAYITLPFSSTELAQFEKQYIIIRHLKSMLELIKTYYPNTSEYALWKEDSVIINSKLLSRNLTPIITELILNSNHAITRIELSEHKSISPIYLEPIIDYRDLVNSKVVFDQAARKHMCLSKFDTILGFSRTQLNYDLLSQTIEKNLNIAPFIKESVIPLLYKGKAAIGIRTVLPNSNVFFSVGLYPVKGIFSVRTLMPPEIVTLNNRTITSLYSAKEVDISGRVNF